MNLRSLVALAALISVSWLVGCGEGAAGAGRKPVFRANGVVKLFGAPLSDATVTFAPLDGQPTAFGTTDDKGEFSLTTYEFGDGGAAGKYKVIISKHAGLSQTATTGGSDHEAAESAASSHDAKGAGGQSRALVPAVFTSMDTTTLTAEITADGENSFPFELK